VAQESTQVPESRQIADGGRAPQRDQAV
jgi:hypothetical protein